MQPKLVNRSGVDKVVGSNQSHPLGEGDRRAEVTILLHYRGFQLGLLAPSRAVEGKNIGRANESLPPLVGLVGCPDKCCISQDRNGGAETVTLARIQGRELRLLAPA